MKKSNSPILGIGNDIIEIDRIRDSLEKFGKTFYSKLFTEKEIEYCLSHSDPATRFAGRFAAKEAIAKALGFGFGKHLSWHDIEIINDEMGKPDVFVKNLEEGSVQISISHCKAYATAVAIWIKK